MSLRVLPMLLVLFTVVVGVATPFAPASIAADDKPIITAPKPLHDCYVCTPYCRLHPNAPRCN